MNRSSSMTLLFALVLFVPCPCTRFPAWSIISDMSFKNIRFKRTGLAVSSRKLRQKLGLRLGKKIKRKLGLSRVNSAAGVSSDDSIYGPTGSIVGRY